MATHTTLTSLFTDIADEIRVKKGTSETIVADNFPTEIANLPSGGISESGVFFVDYDGSLVESWDPSSVGSKTALPSNPTHTGLVAQGWNWTLSDIKDYIEDYPDANVYVGQMYATSSGLTEMDITVTKVTGLEVTCNMVGNKNWGDGTNDNLTTHTYSNYGDYTITCDGTSIPSGSSPINGGLFDTSTSNVNRYWCTAIRIGNNVTSIGNYAFKYCYSLTNITIPSSVRSIGDSAFEYCYSLTNITIPSSVRSIGNNEFGNCGSLTNIIIPSSVTSISYSAFAYCYSLTNITIPSSVTSISYAVFNYCYSLTNIIIPSSVTSISYSVFAGCYSLTNITIPSSVTSIAFNTFNNCRSLILYDFASRTNVPTLSNIDAFTNINGICKIIVPDALYNDWIVATNWSTFADYIYKVSEVEE